MSSSLTAVAGKLANGRPLSDADADALASTTDLLALGMLADEARRRRHGDRVTFVRVAEIPMAASSPIPPDLAPPTAGELRIVGSTASLDAAVAFVRSVAEVADGAPVTGFSLHELEAWCTDHQAALEDVLGRLRAAGLELVAEARVDRLRDPERALEAAGRAGLGVARLTIHRVDEVDPHSLLRRVAAWRGAAEAVRAFAPLPQIPAGPHPSTGYDDVKQVALARLLVDNIGSIQVDWALHGPKLAQVALTFGADDVDAVSPVDTRDLGARRAPLEEIRRNIRAASLVPVERNGRFETVR